MIFGGRASRWSARWLRPDRLFELTLFVDLLLLATVIAFAFLPQNATFGLNARSERLEVLFPIGGKPPKWAGLTFQEPDATAIKPQCRKGELILADLVDQPLSMVLTVQPRGTSIDMATTEGTSLGKLVCSNGQETTLKSEATAVVPRTRSNQITLPFGGALTVGALPSEASTNSSMLIDGVLSVEASSFPFRSGRARSETPLKMGEVVKVISDVSGAPAIAYGVIRLGPDFATVMSQAKGIRAEIAAIGQQTGSPVAVAPTLLDKVRAQPEWAMIIFIGALLLNLLSVGREYSMFVREEP